MLNRPKLGEHYNRRGPEQYLYQYVRVREPEAHFLEPLLGGWFKQRLCQVRCEYHTADGGFPVLDGRYYHLLAFLVEGK